MMWLRENIKILAGIPPPTPAVCFPLVGDGAILWYHHHQWKFRFTGGKTTGKSAPPAGLEDATSVNSWRILAIISEERRWSLGQNKMEDCTMYQRVCKQCASIERIHWINHGFFISDKQTCNNLISVTQSVMYNIPLTGTLTDILYSFCLTL